jgi:hypothetical protein
MKKFIMLVVLGLICFSNYQTSAQDNRNRELEKESKYLSPVRYVIVYNEIIQLNSSERRLDLIMDEKQFNKENLIKIFDLMKKRYPSPFRLNIEVHTSLATIETPEEKEKVHSNVGRLDNEFFTHKTAGYTRFNNGREAFVYTANLSPYEGETVVLIDKPISEP